MSLLEPAPRPRSRLWVGVVLLVVLAAGGAAFARFYLHREITPLDSPAGLALGRSVPAFLEEAHERVHAGGSPDDQKARIPTVLDKPAREALGDDVTERLTALLRTTVDIDAAGIATDDLVNRFEKDGILLEKALEARGLPYFVDPALVRFRRTTNPVLYAYYVERENLLSGPDKRFRSLFVRRLDDLRFRPTAVGYTSPSSTAALILLDDVERQLIDFILPAVAAKDDTLLVDLDSVDPDSGWQRDLRARAAAIVKGAFAGVPGVAPAQIEELGALFFQRRRLVRGWMKTLDKQRYKLQIPVRFIPEADYANELVGRIPLTELREWRTIHERLMEPPVTAAFDALADQQARAVEQHEAQHQLDFDRDKILVPKPVAEIFGWSRADDALDDKLALYVASEVSAYLAELSRCPGTAAVVLMTLAEHAFDRDAWGGAYSIAALVVLEGLGKDLGAPPARLVTSGDIDRALLTKLFVAITDHPDQEIRASAKRTWESWFEGQLPDLKQEKTTSRPPWRH